MLLLEKIHGHVALLGIALLFHPYFALRKARRPSWAARISGYLATGFAVAMNVLGYVIYPEYRRVVKPELYRESVFLGQLFEVKEHLGWYSVCLALAGAVLMAMSTRPGGTDLRGPIRTTYTLAGVLALAVAVMGIYLASVLSFPYELTVD